MNAAPLTYASRSACRPIAVGDLPHAVAHVDDEGAARGVEVGPPVVTVEPAALRRGRCAGSAASASGRRRGTAGVVGGHGRVVMGGGGRPETGPFRPRAECGRVPGRAPGAGTRGRLARILQNMAVNAPPLGGYGNLFPLVAAMQSSLVVDVLKDQLLQVLDWYHHGLPRFRWGTVIHCRNERGRLRFGAITPQGESLLLSEPMLDGLAGMTCWLDGAVRVRLESRRTNRLSIPGSTRWPGRIGLRWSKRWPSTSIPTARPKKSWRSRRWPGC